MPRAPGPRRARRGWPRRVTSARTSSSTAPTTVAPSPRSTCRCWSCTGARTRPSRRCTPPRWRPASRAPSCAGWTPVVISPTSSTRPWSTPGSPSSWWAGRRRADGRDHPASAEGPPRQARCPAAARCPPGLGDEALPVAQRGPHPDRGDRDARGGAEPRGRHRRLLPPGRAERRRRRVPPLAPLQERAEPQRRSRSLGPYRRSGDAPLLMADAAIRLERRGGVVRCTLDRPPLNLFEPGLIASLRATFETLAADASVRVAILAGAGRAFTAGVGVHLLRGLDAAPPPPPPTPGPPPLAPPPPAPVPLNAPPP